MTKMKRSSDASDVSDITKRPKLAQSDGEPSSSTGLRPAEIDAALQIKIHKLRQQILTKSKKEMKWKPSAKFGRAAFSAEIHVPSTPVLEGAFQTFSKKPFKSKRIPTADFEGEFGTLRRSSRYSDLYITSDHINVR